MAKKSSSTDFRDVASAISHRQYAPVYLLMGDEDYYIDRLADMIETSVIPEDERDFNQTVFYGSGLDVKQVMSRAQQFPLMCDRQVVFLKEAQSMERAKSKLEFLAAYAGHPNETTILVITYKGESLPANHPLVKAIQKNGGVVFKSERLRDYQLSGPLQDYCRERKIKIDSKSLNLLCDYIGSPLSKLFGEVDKLIVASGGTGEINPDLIEAVIGISKEYNSYELIKALSVKDYPKSMRIVSHFAANPKQNPGVVVLATIFNYFSKLFIASILKDKSDLNLMAELDLKNSYALTDYKEGLRRYRPAAIDAIIHAIRNQDVMSKGVGSAKNEWDLMKELIFTIFTVN